LEYTNCSEQNGLHGIKQNMKGKDSVLQPDFPEGSFLFRNYRGLEFKSPQSSASEENQYR